MMLLHTKSNKSLYFLNKKAQNLTNHAAEQKKHRESLSPEQKAQTLSNDAAAHKKQRESFFPDDKL